MASPIAAADLESYRWKNRLLIVSFADCERRDAFERTWPGAASGSRERDLVVLRADADLRRSLGWPENANKVRLIGKDGTMKAEWERPPEPSAVFAIIDAMPMRQSEAKRP
ncbi:MAG: DUF4174 domain-containing protein [Terrimicrobiaceae bacterium]|nr:DUF4174 domain-containing protein [Terrimicrobiaceae bacterium]